MGTLAYGYLSEIEKKVGEEMAKKKTEEVNIVAGKRNNNEVTDLEVFIKNKKIGSILQEKDDRQIQLTYFSGRKGSAVSIDDAIHSIIADYNLHN